MVEPITQPLPTVPVAPLREVPLIDERAIKMILYLGLRGEVSLPAEERKVDIVI